MSQGVDMDHVYEKNVTDYLQQVSRALYVFGSLLFIGGLWVDWKNPGQVVIQAFAIADDPHPNSGLFVGGLLVVIVGFAISRVAAFIYERRYAPSDDPTHHQEWVVDLGNEE